MTWSQEDREEGIQRRIEAGKEQLRLAQLTLTAFAEGLGLAATAKRIGRSRTVAWKLRVWLGVQTGKTHGGRTGRRATRAAVLEVRP